VSLGERPRATNEVQPGGLRRFGPLALAIVLLAAFGFLGLEYVGELHRLAEAPPLALAGILLLYLLARSSAAEIMRLWLGAQGYEVSRARTFVLTILISYTNLLVPRAGVATPMLSLRRSHGVDMLAYGAIVIASTAMMVIAVGFCGLACQLLLVLSRGEPFDPAAGLLFAGAAAAALGMFVVPLPEAGGLGSWLPARVEPWVLRLREGWTRLSSSRSLLLRITGLQIAGLLLRAARLWVAYWAVGAEVDFVGVMLSSLLADLAHALSITPAGLGFREWAIVYGATLTGVDPALGLSAALLDRLVWSIGVVVLGQTFAWLHLRDDPGVDEGNAD